MAEAKPVAPAQDRSSALVQGTRASENFGKYAQEREEWLATPIATPRALAISGMPFTILKAAERDMPATDLDVGKGVEPGTMIRKSGYLCETQADTLINEPSAKVAANVIKSGDKFLLLFTSNSIRSADLDRIQTLLREDGKVVNVCVKQIDSKRPGMNPAHTLVAAEQWKPLE